MYTTERVQKYLLTYYTYLLNLLTELDFLFFGFFLIYENVMLK